MGVHKATHAYVQIYGHNDKRVLRTDNPPPPPDGDVTALIDLPTYHIPTLSSLAIKTAIAVNNNGSKLGQLVLFCNSDNVIHDSLFDSDMCLSQEDVDTAVSEVGHVNSVKNYKLSFCSRNCSFMESFSSKVKKWIRFQRNDMRVVLVPVVFPHGCIDKLKSFISEVGFPRSPEVAMPVSGSGDAARGNCCGHKAFREWLNMNRVKEGRFITFDHVYNAICESKSSENYKYGCAVVTQSMEGILLTYAHFMVSKIKKLFGNRYVKRKQTAAAAPDNSAVLFYDGKPPVIKSYRRFKREEARRQRLKSKNNEISECVTPEMIIKQLMVLCEKSLLMIPQCIYRVALLDVFRLPLYEQLNIKNLFMTVTDGSEAEDDMVRLAAFAANINIGIRGDKKSLLKLGHGDSRMVRSGVFVNNYLKTNVDWTTVCTETLFKNPGTSVDLYSFDSDVIAKWDSLVRHSAESSLCFGDGGVDDDLRARMKKVAGNIKSIFFFRSLVNKGAGVSRAVPSTSVDSSDDEHRLMLGKRRIVALDDDDDEESFGSPYYNGMRSCSNNSFDIYDLTHSPVLRSVESTLLLMVVNGCDYVDPLVSPETASKFDVQIREETSLFENYACMCVLTKEDNEKFRLLPYKQDQYQHYRQRESLRCRLCNKTKVPEFIEVKRFFINRADPVYSRFPKAVNAAGNIMALLSLSCFNQKIFGSISGMADKNKIKAVEVSSSVRKAKNVFFCEHTQGGIPMYGDFAVASAINKDRAKIFKHLGIDEYMKGVPSRKEYMIKNSAAFIQSDPEQNRKFRFSLGNLLQKRDKEETIHEILSFGMDKEGEIEGGDNGSTIITDIWFDGEEGYEETTKSSSNTTIVTKKENAEYNDKDEYEISKLLLEKENLNNRPAATDVTLPTVASATCPYSDHNNRENIHNIELIVSAMTSSVTGTEDYILSLLTNILRSNASTRGIDDARSKQMSYSEKAMDLLVIVYLNICGLQDPASDHMYREDGSREQYIPIIHAELCGNASPGTTRNYFVAALHEMSLAMYRYGLSEGSSLPQTRRRNRDVINKKLELYDKEMSICEVEVFNEDVKAVYGAARVKPWSALALLGAKLFYEARIHNSSNGFRSRNISG